jgi:hypothetical protein
MCACAMRIILRGVTGIDIPLYAQLRIVHGTSNARQNSTRSPSISLAAGGDVAPSVAARFAFVLAPKDEQSLCAESQAGEA